MDMITMGLAGMAMSMQQAQLQSAVSTQVVSKTMDTQSQQAAQLLQDFQENAAAVTKVPFGTAGHFFDARA